jgi:S1-C subfamily serine protease
MVIVTNYHVVQNAINITVTFINGDGYPATVLGSDPYSDLAVVSTNAPQSEFKPLEIVSSLTLRVGDIVVAVGNPYGLAGSMSIGIVSALGRTITEEQTGGYPIANVIQTTCPLNPGNSGGPLLNLEGKVVGITTAIVSNSQGLGFAIPSNTILREISSLVTIGSYNKHPWLGAAGHDIRNSKSHERKRHIRMADNPSYKRRTSSHRRVKRWNETGLDSRRIRYSRRRHNNSHKWHKNN